MTLTESLNFNRLIDSFMLGLQAGVLIVCTMFIAEMLF